MLSMQPVAPGTTAQPSWQTSTGGRTTPQPITLACHISPIPTQPPATHAIVLLWPSGHSCGSRRKPWCLQGYASQPAAQPPAKPLGLGHSTRTGLCLCRQIAPALTPSSPAADGGHDAGGHRCGSPAAHLCLGRKLLPGLWGRGPALEHAPAAGPAACGGLACPQLLRRRAPGVWSMSPEWSLCCGGMQTAGNKSWLQPGAAPASVLQALCCFVPCLLQTCSMQECCVAPAQLHPCTVGPHLSAHMTR